MQRRNSASFTPTKSHRNKETAQQARQINHALEWTLTLREEMKKYGIKLANIEPGKPWLNGSNESFNGTFRKECLSAEIFASKNGRPPALPGRQA